jgi:hypothetical protein
MPPFADSLLSKLSLLFVATGVVVGIAGGGWSTLLVTVSVTWFLPTLFSRLV